MTFNPQSPAIDNVDNQVNTLSQQISNLPTGTQGMLPEERQTLNDVVSNLANIQFNQNLDQLNFDGGVFSIFRNQLEIQSENNAVARTLETGDPQGRAQLPAPFDASFQGNTNEFNIDLNGENAIGPFSFSEDGTSFYQLYGVNSPKTIGQYELSTPFDLSTRSLVGEIQEDQVEGDFAIEILNVFNNESKLYTGAPEANPDSFDRESGKVFEYEMNTPGDITTLERVNTQQFSGGKFMTNFVKDITFSPDGTQFFVSIERRTNTSNRILKANLSTPFDLSTANFQFPNNADQVLNLGRQVKSVGFSPDGKLLFVGGNSIGTFRLGTPFDLNTASLVDEEQIRGDKAEFSQDGTKLATSGFTLEDGKSTEDGVAVTPIDTPNSGTVTLQQKDLSLEENGGFATPPKTAVVTQRADIPDGTQLEYILRDGDGNTVTVTQADVDEQVDTSAFTSRQVEVELSFTRSGKQSPIAKEVFVHFQE